MAAVLGVGLREHHQLHVGRVAAESRVGQEQVVDLVRRQREPEPGIGGDERAAPVARELHARKRSRRLAGKQPHTLLQRIEHRLDHAIVQHTSQLLEHSAPQRYGATYGVDGAALDAPDRGQAADVGDVGGLAGPWRDGAGARRDHHEFAAGDRRRREVRLEQAAKYLGLARGQRPGQICEVVKAGLDGLDPGVDRTQRGQQLFEAETGQGGRTRQ